MINLLIKTHDGEVFNVSVDEYDAQALNEQINDESVLTIAIGDLILSRINFKSIVPVKE